MSTLRDDIIKLAHDNPGKVRDALLPVLAKTRTARRRITMRDIGKINRLMARNFHLEAVYELAKLLDRRNDAKKLKGLMLQADELGYSTEEAISLRQKLSRPMYEVAKTVMIQDAAGNPVSLYELLD